MTEQQNDIVLDDTSQRSRKVVSCRKIEHIEGPLGDGSYVLHMLPFGDNSQTYTHYITRRWFDLRKPVVGSYFLTYEGGFIGYSSNEVTVQKIPATEQQNTKLPEYQLHMLPGTRTRLVKAAKITNIESLRAVPDGYAGLRLPDDSYRLHFEEGHRDVSQKWLNDRGKCGSVTVGGYFVVYEDGYTSFSPASTFEGAYTPLGKKEAPAVPNRDVAPMGPEAEPPAETRIRAFCSLVGQELQGEIIVDARHIDDGAIPYLWNWVENELLPRLSDGGKAGVSVRLQRENHYRSYEALNDAAAPKNEPMIRHFAFAHLPLPLAAVSRPFCALAESVVRDLARSPERTECLLTLLVAKDWAVRAMEDKVALDKPAEKAVE